MLAGQLPGEEHQAMTRMPQTEARSQTGFTAPGAPADTRISPKMMLRHGADRPTPTSEASSYRSRNENTRGGFPEVDAPVGAHGAPQLRQPPRMSGLTSRRAASPAWEQRTTLITSCQSLPLIFSILMGLGRRPQLFSGDTGPCGATLGHPDEKAIARRRYWSL